MDSKFKLSEHFTLGELCKTSTGLKNEPLEWQINNLRALCINVLEPLREFNNGPLFISSGYRSKEVNERVGGARFSYHTQGKAADIAVQNVSGGFALAFFCTTLQGVLEVFLERRGNTHWLHVAYDINYEGKPEVDIIQK